MKKDVIISIQGGQMVSEIGQPEPVELITPGRLSREGGDYLITYRESELTGLEGTITTLRVAERCVTLSREGEVCSLMIFEQGQRHLSYNETGECPLTIGVSAQRVRTALTDDGGLVEVDYEIEIDQAITGMNRITVNVSTIPS